MRFKKFLPILLSALFFFSAVGFSVAADEPVLQVSSFMKTAKAGDGPLTVVGVVTAVYPDKKLFGLADLRTSGCCESSQTCNEPAIPVTYAGELPKLKSKVSVSGKVETDGGKLIFAAQSVGPMKTSAK